MADLLQLIEDFGLLPRVVHEGEELWLGVEAYPTSNLPEFMERSFKYGYPKVERDGMKVTLYWTHIPITLH